MRSHRGILGVLLAALLLAGGLSASADGAMRSGPHRTSADAVSTRNQVAVITLTGLLPPDGGAPSAVSVHVAMVQGAVYDAVNAIGPRRYQPYLLEERFPARASKDAAVATAAHAVLAHIVSSVPTMAAPARAALLVSLATQYGDFLSLIPDGRSKDQGVAAGEAAGEAMIGARQDDGRFGPSPWVPSTAVGHWTPLTNPDTGQPALDPTPWLGAVTPFLLESSSQFRTRGPQNLTSATWARELNEVKAIGAVDSKVRTSEQTYIARWWQSSPVATWNSVTRQLVARADLDAVAAARLFALQNLSTADASINCWNDKYHWDFWRPWNSIPRAAEDGNPATTPQADWRPLISAPYPSHPSGHLCQDGANVRVLSTAFGDRVRGGYKMTSASPLLQLGDDRTRTFRSFSQLLAEVVEARIWAGLHYRTADEQGKKLGWSVADYAAENYFQRVRHGS